MRIYTVQKIFIVAIFALFAASTAITMLEGFGIESAAFWSFMNILGSTFPTNLKLIDAENPGILISLIFGIVGEFFVTVLLTTVFYHYMSGINIRARIVDYRRKKLKRHVILTPINAFSMDLASMLKKNDIPFILLDQREKLVDRANREKALSAYGDPTQASSLAYARLQNASYMILLGEDDIRNMLIAITARKLNKRIRIAARTKTEEDIPRMHMVGINKTLLPEIAIGDEIAGFLLKQKKQKQKETAA